MIRKSQSIALVLTFVTSLFIPLHSLQANPKKPNVVLIVADDLGWADLACYGSTLHETPNLDLLSQEGVKFTSAYSSAAICSPTRAAILTGKHPARMGMTIWHEWAARGPDRQGEWLAAEAEPNLQRKERTLAEVLKSAGYKTFHVGKWHLGDAAHYPETQGFEINLGGTLWGAPPTFFWPYRGPFGSELRYIPGIVGGHKGEYLTDRLTTEALSLVEKHKDQPFYLNLWFHTVHTPIEGKKELVEYFKKKVKPGAQHDHPIYAAMVKSLDENVGRVLKKLDELKLKDNTLVIFTSDNGGVVHTTRWGVVTDNSPFRSGKGSLYEGGIRVPLLIRMGSRFKKGTVIPEPVTSHDLFPTIIELLGVQSHFKNKKIDGLSLKPLLNGEEASLNRKNLYWHYPHFYPTTQPVSAIRQDKYKLLHFHIQNRYELYDLTTDQGERTNLMKKHPKVGEGIKNELEAWLSSIDAKFPRKIKK